MSYEVLLAEETREDVAALDEKSTRIVKDNLRKLADDQAHKRYGFD